MKCRCLIVGLVAFLLSLNVDAQIQDCEAVLTQALDEFGQGHFTGIPGMLDECLSTGFSREQRQRAYQLLVQTYLILDDPIGAKASYLNLLRSNPEFIADPERDPIDVVYLSRKFTATPIVSVFAYGGLNTQLARVIYEHLKAPNETKTYTPRSGFHLGGGIDWNINDNMVLTGEVNYAYSSYEVYSEGYFRSRASSETFDALDTKDHQHWLDIPISVKYVDNTGKIRPFGYLGYAVDLLFADYANFGLTNPDVASITEDNNGNPVFHSASQNLNTPSKKMTPLRNTFNRSFFLGGGIRVKFGLNFVFADLRYSFGNTNISNGKYTDAEVTQDIAFMDDYFRLDRVSLSLGYIWPLYKPRELRKARTRGVLRNVMKNEEGTVSE